MKLTKRLGAILMMAMLVLAMSMSASAAKAKINKKNLKLTVGQTANLKVKNTTGKVKWSSSDATVATVKKGKVTAVKAGTAVITAKNKKKTYKCNVTVEEAKTTPSTEAPTTTPKTEEPKSADKVVVINDANFAQEFDKYFGKVVISEYYLDKDGNLLSPNNYVKGSLYEKVKFDKNGNATVDESTKIPDKSMVKDAYFYYLKDGNVSDLMTFGVADMQYHVNLYELNVSGSRPVFAKLLATNTLYEGYFKDLDKAKADEYYDGINWYDFNGELSLLRDNYLFNYSGRMMLGFNYGYIASTNFSGGKVDVDDKTDLVKQVAMLKIEDEVFRNVDFHLYLR